MSQTIEVGGNTVEDIVEDILRSRIVRVILIIVALIITILGYVIYQPEVKPGIFGKIWLILESYWYGFNVIVSRFIEDESLANIIAFIIRAGFTMVLVLSIIKPLLGRENVLKFLVYAVLICVFIIVVYVAVSILLPIVESVEKVIKNV